MSAPPPWTAAHDTALQRFPLLGLNVHYVDAAHRDLLGRQIRAAAAAGVGYDLDAEPEPGVPRVLVAFYDGFAETGRFGAQLCHDLGLRAFFFPILHPVHGETLLDDDDLADIATAHEVGFHSATHASAVEVTADRLRDEVLEPVQRLRELTGRTPRVGAWRGGGRFDPALPGNQALRELGVTHLVSNWSVERVPGAA